MLRLSGLTKIYKAGDTEIKALKSVDLSFRPHEFVSILGPSGCGKTTMLNIIGGLDKYTSGDLFIDGISTKKYGDHDWDVYRNHRIGFVFQSYNLIPHQTILGNVELALTIGGISKQERVEKAKKTLDRVGLAGQYNKKPNQLSGGQCQRVAIARALVNDPEILLADEPTGALDTATSYQIMDLIKEISQERLIIMVTHNPELAQAYSSRIVNILDGEIIGDSNPYSAEDEQKEYQPDITFDDESERDSKRKQKRNKRRSKKAEAKMTPFTAFRLSAHNLWSKKGRTFLTSLAGSIGIIGVSLVLAISSGIQNYIFDMQDDMLSGNPITVSKTTYDMDALTESMGLEEKTEMIREGGRVYIDNTIEGLIKTMSMSDSLIKMNEFTDEYMQYLDDMPKEYYAAIIRNYGIQFSNNIYTNYRMTTEDSGEWMSVAAIKATCMELIEQDLDENTLTMVSDMLSDYTETFSQVPDNPSYILDQYDILAGKKIATEKNEIMIVVNSSDGVSDMLFANLGYLTQEEFVADLDQIYTDERLEKYKESFSYEELLDKTFVWHSNNAVFTKDGGDKYRYKARFDKISDPEAVPLKVVAVLRPKKNISYGCLRSGIYYTQALTDYVMQSGASSEIVQYLQTENKSAFGAGEFSFEIRYSPFYDPEYDANGDIVVRTETGYIGTFDMTSIVTDIMTDYTKVIPFLLSADWNEINKHGMSALSTVSLIGLGGATLPTNITIYPTDFDHVTDIRAYLDKWNQEGEITLSSGQILQTDARGKIVYTDTLTMIIGLINNIVKIITTALVAFTAISLVVSTAMIGIITYVSVVERVKEIGVLRSLGARKFDVSMLFTSETFIIGFVSGVIGVVATYLISIVINVILMQVIGIGTLAALPWWEAIAMVVISVVLTLISGVLPATSAAKKDPVVSLRSE